MLAGSLDCQDGACWLSRTTRATASGERASLKGREQSWPFVVSAAVGQQAGRCRRLRGAGLGTAGWRTPPLAVARGHRRKVPRVPAFELVTGDRIARRVPSDHPGWPYLSLVARSVYVAMHVRDLLASVVPRVLRDASAAQGGKTSHAPSLSGGAGMLSWGRRTGGKMEATEQHAGDLARR